MTFAQQFRAARGSLTQEGAAAALSGPDAASKCSVRTVQDWESGRRTPPGWVRWLIVGQLMRSQLPAPKKKRASHRKGSNAQGEKSPAKKD